MIDAIIQALANDVEVKLEQPTNDDWLITCRLNGREVSKTINIKNKRAFKNSLSLSVERAIQVAVQELTRG
jgi:hypothetical protein